MAKTKKKRKSPERLLKISLQLVVQSFDFPFVGVDFLKNGRRNEEWLDDRLVRKIHGGPAQWYCVNEKRAVCEKKWVLEEKKRESAISRVIYEDSKESFGECFNYPPRQCFTSYYINKKGLYVNEDPDDVNFFPDRLYEEFLEANTKQKLSNFARRYNFCDFEDIQKHYTKFDLEPYAIPRIIPTEKTKTAQMNWMHLFNKKMILSRIVSLIRLEKTVPQRDIDYLLNEISTKTKNILINREKYKILENADVDDEFDHSRDYVAYRTDAKERFEEVVIVFGHYALCCMELLEEIKKSVSPVRYCENRKCQKALPRDASPLLMHHKNSPVCHKQYKAQQKKIERKNKKIFEKHPKRKKLKRRYP